MTTSPGQQDFGNKSQQLHSILVIATHPLLGGTLMFAPNLLRAVFVLAFVVLAGSAYATHPPCCLCGQTGNCTDCGCGDVAAGKLLCLQDINEEDLLATFTDPDGKPVKFPLQDNGTLKKFKGMVGQCGLVKLVEQVVCTDFKAADGSPQQQQQRAK